MSGRKNVMPPFRSISSGDMSGNLTSKVSDISNCDNVGIQLVWTGTPTGTFAVQVSLDKTTWIALSLSTAITAAGSADSALIDLNQLSFPNIRVVYTRTSGTGTLDMWISGKMV